MNFSEALTRIKGGASVVRRYWLEKIPVQGQSVRLAHPLPHQVPYLEILTTEGLWMPWTPTQKDLMAEDWEVVQ